MSNENSLEIFKDYPEIIHPSVSMQEPNESILIYRGQFKLIQEEKQIIIDGEITFNWFPSSGSQGFILET